MAATASSRNAGFLLLLLCFLSTTALVLAARGVVDAELKSSPAGGYNKKPIVKQPPVYPAPGTTKPGPVYQNPGTNKPGPVYKNPGTTKPGPVYQNPGTNKPGPVYQNPGTNKPGGKAPPVYPAPGTTKPGPGAGGGIPTIPGFTIPGMGGIGNGIPGLGGGWGGGYGGPAGGYTRGGVVAPSAVCSEKGRCYGKRVTCPKKCFSSYSGAGKGYGGGGGGGSCTFDCKVKCTAYC
ncbi:hypothetical protein PR202_ga12992 [Eleusine coracana subsp. coracana]|uniref:Uncharacterized protein n=1 Tax=Eleusine coracana subsp. coracana TaxID=191504 RepID=A0AAV5CD61_ELECO|nr:hypothetical protein PR202_ga12992 [Eleusine coracana subsp. coracana]